MTLTPESCPTRLLSDIPTAEDQFSHGSVARAIAEALGTEKGGKCIGLTGIWGSGKSSVIRILDGLVDKESVHIAVFDAWAHQGDPLRRALLDNFIEGLRQKGWLNHAEQWQKKQESLTNKRTITYSKANPVLKGWGIAILASLLAEPAGVSLVSNITKFGTDYILGLVGACLIALPFVLVAVAFGVSKWQGKGVDDVLSLLSHQTRTETQTEALSSPDPTSVEFQKFFGELVRDALNDESRKLVLVIDNLDRVDADDALAIWSTLRTFFDFPSHAPCPALERLWVIIPFDRGAIRRLWAHGIAQPQLDPTLQSLGTTGDEDLGDSFVDKTFQVIFHVPQPVLSEWERYLKSSLREAFPNTDHHTEEEFHKVYRVFDRRLNNGFRVPTPRDIKRFVNRLGAIHRQWQDRIPLEVQALYVANGDGHAHFDAALLSPNFLNRLPEEMFPANWREQVTAIHYNVEPERALQVLLFERIRSALIKGDVKALEETRGLYGFTKVLEQVVETSAPQWAESEPQVLTRAALCLEQLSLDRIEYSVNEVWRRLTAAASRVRKWEGFGASTASGLTTLLKYNADGKALCQSVANSIKIGGNDEPENLIEWLDGLVIFSERYFPDHATEFQSSFVIPGSAKIYVSVLHDAWAHEKTKAECVRAIKTAARTEDVVAEFIRIVNEGKFDNNHRAMCAFLAVAPKLWAPLTLAIGNRLSGPSIPGTEIGDLMQSLITLKRKGADAASNLEKIINNGFVLHHLYQAIAATPKSPAAVASCAISLLLFSPAAGVQTGQGPNWGAGQQNYNNLLSNPKSMPDVVNSAVTLTARLGVLREIIEASSKHTPASPFIAELLRSIAVDDAVWVQITPEILFVHYEQVRAALGDDLLKKILAKSAQHSGLADFLAKQAVTSSNALLFVETYKLAAGNSQLQEKLVSSLRNIVRATWISELQSDGSLLSLVIEMAANGVPVALTGQFHDALIEHAINRLENKVTPPVSAANWGYVIDALTKEFQSTLRSRLIEALCEEDRALDAVLQLYGEFLLDSEFSGAEAERLVLTTLPRITERTAATELRWAVSALKLRPELLTTKEATLNALRQRVREKYKAGGSKVPEFVEFASLLSVDPAGMPELHDTKAKATGQSD